MMYDASWSLHDRRERVKTQSHRLPKFGLALVAGPQLINAMRVVLLDRLSVSYIFLSGFIT